MAGKKTSDAQIRAAVRHNRAMGSITIRPSKEEDNRIREAARAAGQSITAYIMDAVRARMDRDGVPGASQADGQ